MQTSGTHWESFKDSVVHLLYVTGYFSVIALVAVAFDLILLGVYVFRSMWEKLKGH